MCGDVLNLYICCVGGRGAAHKSLQKQITLHTNPNSDVHLLKCEQFKSVMGAFDSSYERNISNMFLCTACHTALHIFQMGNMY